MSKKRTGYVWGWSDEGQDWNPCNTIIECLAAATRDLMTHFTPDEFIDLMLEHCLYVYIVDDTVKDGYLVGKLRMYRLAMSGRFYKIAKNK